MSARNALIRVIHVAKRELALDDDAYRDLLQRASGKRSCKDLSNDQLKDVLRAFKKAGFTSTRRSTRADTAHARKIRALWLSLFELDVVRDRRETALRAFAKRQTKVDDLRFLKADQAHRVIEALKDWAEREADVDWAAYDNPREAVVRAQWWRANRGVSISGLQLAEKLERAYGPAVTGKSRFADYDDDDWDQLIRALGDLVRRTRDEEVG